MQIFLFAWAYVTKMVSQDIKDDTPIIVVLFDTPEFLFSQTANPHFDFLVADLFVVGVQQFLAAIQERRIRVAGTITL
jgi:hypothetical protein